ncbi:hypothetical protein Q4506_00790 [Colwellia sp. 4_MG-2023]|jgi:hypothetical protein|uniref:hypothetical protein n=1 Tax=unclassified Colwellia TaxID=196834 RepID=UPI0026E1B861|nr:MULTISPECIES: hypothetical protein [unclassified Colwellia]MDO6505514.1 hypothetical protein [Colwellia sp. 5_MG-2023]MDO6554190.1 hypothetical protein [Colwellia sp. 4_MG-2023]
MESYKNKLDIKDLLNLKKEELKTDDSVEIHSLNLALQSIQKRLDYCEYYFKEFIDFSTKDDLLLELTPKHHPNCISSRTIFEASTYAFIQNLHAVIDSLPYALNIIFTVNQTIEDNKVGWYWDFIKQFKPQPFFKSLNLMYNDELFLKLKKLSNTIKHKHLIRIKNNGYTLTFDPFSYENKKEIIEVPNQNVKELIIDTHDKLIPKLLDLYTQIKNAKKKELAALK